MAIYITGDTHGELDIGKLKPKSFDHSGLTRDDYVIILGDFGLLWRNPPTRAERKRLDWLESCPWTTLFIDGNHENFDLLATYQPELWHGGQVRRIREHVMHLCRGEVFDIDGRTFFAMGGAYSVDKQWRVPFETWWPQEVPSEEVRALAAAKIAEVGEVDYVLTHCPPSPALYELAESTVLYEMIVDEYNLWLGKEVVGKLKFKRWFFGHMHVDSPRKTPYTPLYDCIFDLDGTGRTPFGPHTNCDSETFTWPEE